MRVSPEDIAGAFVLAVARGIQTHEPADVMKAWCNHIRSAPWFIVIMPSQMDR